MLYNGYLWKRKDIFSFFICLKEYFFEEVIKKFVYKNEKGVWKWKWKLKKSMMVVCLKDFYGMKKIKN